MHSALTRTKELLGDTFNECESPSLRLEKFVRIGGDKTKHEEIDAVVECQRKNGKEAVFPPLPPGGVRFSARLKSRLIVNQAGGILENAGMCLHPHFGYPYIPGSAVKGVARHAAWCEWHEAKEPEKARIAQDIARIFGYPTNDKKLDIYLRSYAAHSCGSVCFMSAYSGTARLVTDILTPHGGSDWAEPVPSTFLAVEAGAEFSFTVVPIANDVADREKAITWLKTALVNHGVGAKTSSGYGRFLVDGEKPNCDTVVRLHFASPAFLRGAEDEGKLRISTLRGMMRWWWRWLYRSVLTDVDLRSLEQRVWGGCTEEAKASCISLCFVSEPVLGTIPFDKRTHMSRNNQKTNLAYLAYGMDERVNGEVKKRRVLDVSPNVMWELGININPLDRGMSKEQLLLHAKLAIWALCKYGGVGAKSRKGFGSLCCDIEYADMNAVFTDVGTSLSESGIELEDEGGSTPYSYVTSLMHKVKTKTTDAWSVLGRIGYALQLVASDYKHKECKAVLGLPRKIHGPMHTPLSHQKGHFHKPPYNLKADGSFVKNRFASPLIIHLTDKTDGIEVNLTSCPSDYVRDVETSECLLRECVETIKEELLRA